MRTPLFLHGAKPQTPLSLCIPATLSPAGTGQNMFGLNWGNGFITNQDIITSRGLSDPNDFFQNLIRKPYVNNVSGPGTPACNPDCSHTSALATHSFTHSLTLCCSAIEGCSQLALASWPVLYSGLYCG